MSEAEEIESPGADGEGKNDDRRAGRTVDDRRGTEAESAGHEQEPLIPVHHVTSLWFAVLELCGARGLKVTHRDQLDAAMTELFTIDGPALLCVEQDAELL